MDKKHNSSINDFSHYLRMMGLGFLYAVLQHFVTRQERGRCRWPFPAPASDAHFNQRHLERSQFRFASGDFCHFQNKNIKGELAIRGTHELLLQH